MNRPQVLCIAGHDPSGGAGIQADIEACAANGAHALTALTALTVQDSASVHAVRPLEVDWLAAQIERLRADCRPAVIKIGLVGSAEQARFLAALVRDSGLPAVIDPVLRAGGGGVLASDATALALRESLMPAATLVTPNAREARALTGLDDTESAGAALVAGGCAHVLLTGGDEPGETVRNTWHRADAAPRHFDWPRLQRGFHGAGCTLAAAIAARLACGRPLEDALVEAQAFVCAALAQSFPIGHGRHIPNRRV